MFTSPGAVAFTLGNIIIYWYGIIIAIALFVGFVFLQLIAKKQYPNEEKILDNIYDIAFWAILGGIIGARLYYVLLSWNYYSLHLLEIFMLQNGGLSIHGAIVGGLLAGFACCKKNNLNFLKFADLFALVLPISQAIGRWGNFFNSEAFGLPTNLPWGVYIPLNLRPVDLALFEYFHPTFLYESFLNLLVFCILYFGIKKYFIKTNGIVFFSYLILYSICRIFVECIRIDSVLNILGIPVAIWISLIIILISIFILIFLIRKNLK